MDGKPTLPCTSWKAAGKRLRTVEEQPGRVLRLLSGNLRIGSSAQVQEGRWNLGLRPVPDAHEKSRASIIRLCDMLSPYRYLRLRLHQAGLLPMSKTGLVAWYLLGLDVLLFVLQKTLGAFKLPYGDGLGGWVTFLSFVAILLFTFLFLR